MGLRSRVVLNVKGGGGLSDTLYFETPPLTWRILSLFSDVVTKSHHVFSLQLGAIF